MKMKNLNIITSLLVVINVSVFLFTILNTTAIYNFALVPYGVFEKPWTLITSMFLHGGIGHIFWNMIFLFFIGSILELLIGSRRYLITYLVGGLVGGISVIFASSLGFMSPDVMVIGAGGAISGIIGVMIVLKPMPIIMFRFLYTGFHIEVSLLVINILRLFGFLSLLFGGVLSIPGGIAGLIIGLYFRFIEKRHEEYFVRIESGIDKDTTKEVIDFSTLESDWCSKWCSKSLTDLQREEMFNKYKGKHIIWTCEVKNIEESNSRLIMGVKGKFSTTSLDKDIRILIDMKKYQKDKLLKLKIGDTVKYTAKLTHFSDPFQLYAEDGTIID